MNLPTGFDQRFDSLRLVRELGSYSAAAQELNLSPSAIAQQIHALERELDALLFIRDGNRLLPTEVCEIAADYAAQAASLRRRMELEIDASRREVSSLVVGVSPSLEDSAVSEMLARYMQLHPKAQLRIISENSRTLIALLRGRMLDLAIVDSPFPGNEFNSLLLDTDYLTAAVPNGSPLADAGHISLAQLKKEKLILRPAGSGTRTLFEASLKKRGMSLEQFNVDDGGRQRLHDQKARGEQLRYLGSLGTGVHGSGRGGALSRAAHFRFEHGAADTYMLQEGLQPSRISR